ncbi:MAG: GNAT family N-acetyltransferase [Bacteroidota bacterium]
MQKQLTTERLLIRPIIAEDHPHIFAGLSHPEVIKYYGVSYQTLEETQSQMDWYQSLVSEQKGLWWAMIDKADQSFLGALGLNDWDQQNRKAEFGLWLLPQYWGQGYIQEATPAIFKYAFAEMNLHRIEAFVESENQASQKALQRLGFRHEGCMREAEIKNGRFISIEIFAFFEAEFPNT